MAKVLVIGDPHFKTDNIEETDILQKECIKICEKQNPDFVVVLGDILDRHETIHVTALCRSVEFLKNLKNLCKLYVLIGNHDLKNNKQYMSTEHPFSSLKHWGENITIVDKPILNVINDNKFIFCPYIPTGRFIEALNTIDGWKSSKCIFAHQEFKGSDMSGVVSSIGDVWDLENPDVVSGHIHTYQKPQKNILYPGTPFQHNFNDTNNKTVSMLFFDRIYGYTEERISLNIPEKITIRVSYDKLSELVIPPNNKVKIIIYASPSQIAVSNKNLFISKWRKKGFKILFSSTNTKNDKITNTKPEKYTKIFHSKLKEKKLYDFYVSIKNN